MNHSRELKDRYRKLHLCIDCGSGPLTTTVHCEKCRLKARIRAKLYSKNNRQKVLKSKSKWQHQSWEPLKREVLTHYGPKGVLGCCWEGCMVVDLDMLSLDHIHDDGYKHCKEGSTVRLSGRALYYWARLNGYPTDLQTLCWNHQWKKRLEKIREKSHAFNERI